jgi:hypothetical protein
MEVQEQVKIDRMVRSAAALLSASSNAPVELCDPRPILHGTRNRVFRCALRSEASGLPASVVLKEPRGGGYEPDTTRSPAYEVFNDWVGTSFASRRSKIPPRLLAGDRSTGLIVIEDVGEVPHVYDVLNGSDPAAGRAALIGFARAVGELHAAGHDRTEEFVEMRVQLGPMRITMEERLRRSLGTVLEVLESIGLTLPVDASEEIDEVLDFVADPGSFLTFLHGDMCPVNGLLTAEGLRLIDFEFCHVGNALLDLVPMRTNFSICGGGGRVPEPIVREMESAYRAALVAAVPTAEDDAVFDRALALATGVTVLVTLGGPFPALSLKPVLQRDFEWGPATPRQRIVTRLDSVGVFLTERDHLPGIQVLATATSQRLKSLWPEAARGMDYFPAFQGELTG